MRESLVLENEKCIAMLDPSFVLLLDVRAIWNDQWSASRGPKRAMLLTRAVVADQGAARSMTYEMG